MSVKAWEITLVIEDLGLGGKSEPATNLTRQEILEIVSFDVPEYVRVFIKNLKVIE